MKKHLLTLLCLCGVSWLTGSAETTLIKCSSQEEFEQLWTVESGGQGEWKWVDTDDYASEPTIRWYRSKSGDTSPVIWMKVPETVNPGDAYFYISNTTADYNDDHKLYFYVSDEQAVNTNTKKIVDGTNRYNQKELFPTYTESPTSESMAKVTLEEGKTYYIGVKANGTGSLSGSAGYGSINNISFFIFNYIKIVQYEDTPDKATNLAVTLHNESLDNCYATFSWKWPSKSKLGNNITKMGAKIYRCPDGNQSNNGILKDEYLIKTLPIEERNVNETFSYDDTAENSGDKAVTIAGKYYYAVVPYNEVGDYEPGSSSIDTKEASWIGEDVGLYNPLNLTARLDGDKVILSYNFDEARRKSRNGGYIDENQVSLMFTRQKSGDAEPTILTKDHKNWETYTDESGFDGFAIYTYRIYSLYKGDEENKSPEQNTKILAGGYITLDTPYTQDFSESNAFDYFSTTGNTSISYYWKRAGTEYSGGYYAQFSPYSYYGSEKSTLVTPPLWMEAGQTYRVSFSTWKSSSTGAVASFQVRCGTDPSNFAASTELNTQFTGTSSAKGSIEVFVTPTQTGVNFIGFYAESSTTTMNIDDICIEKATVAPGIATDISFDGTPTEENEFQSVLTFTLPAVDKSGNELNEDSPAFSKVVITRSNYGESTGTNVVPTTEDIVIEATEDAPLLPGQVITYTDAVPARAYYTYTIVSHLENGEASDPATSDKKWVGYDTPKTLMTFSNNMNEDKTAAVFEIKPSTSGIAQHNGYIDSESIEYRVYIDGEEEPIITAPYDENETSITLTYPLINEDVWGKYTFIAVMANHGYEGPTQKSGTFVGGNVIEETEINPDIENDENCFELWDQTAGWGYYQKTLRAHSTVDKNANAIYLPPFELKDAANLGSTIDLTLYRADDDDEEYKANGEVLEIYLYDLNLDEGQEPIKCVDTRGKIAFPPVAEEIFVDRINVNVTKDEKISYSKEVVAPAPGKYRFAFKVASEKVEDLYISSIDIKLGATETVKVPEAIEGLAASVDALGANSVDLTFTLPSQLVSGREIEEISEVVVERAQGLLSDDKDGLVFAPVTVDIEDLTAGSEVKITDNVPEAGFYTYRVSAVLNDVSSEAVEVETAWVGIDTPVAPEVEAEVVNNNAVITWSMPESVSVHGGFVDREALTYTIYRSDVEEAIANNVTGDSYTDNAFAKLEWNVYSYSVVASFRGLSSEESDSNTILGGDVVSGNTIEADFSDESSVETWQFSDWKVEDGKLVAQNVDLANNSVELPPFRIDDDNELNCLLNLTLSATEEAEEVLAVYLCKFDDTATSTPGRQVKPKAADVELMKIESLTATSAEADKTLSFDLPETGKYRLVLKCESAENKGLFLSALSLEVARETTSVSDLIDNSKIMIAGGILTLPEGCVRADIFNLAGLRISAVENNQTIDISHLTSGIYLVNLTLSDGSAQVVKIYVK